MTQPQGTNLEYYSGISLNMENSGIICNIREKLTL